MMCEELPACVELWHDCALRVCPSSSGSVQQGQGARQCYTSEQTARTDGSERSSEDIGSPSSLSSHAASRSAPCSIDSPTPVFSASGPFGEKNARLLGPTMVTMLPSTAPRGG